MIYLYSHSLTFHLTHLLTIISLGTIAIYLSRASQVTGKQIHRITFPVAVVLSAITEHFISDIDIISVFPALFLYYGILTIPASTSSVSLGSRLRHHPLLKKILHKDDSKRIFTFLCLNLGFMCVQMGYGIYTNSLGLVSDSIHMLVDCVAIAFGLAASVLGDDSFESATDTNPTGHNCHDHHHEDNTSHPHSHSHKHSHDHTHNHTDSHNRTHSHDTPQHCSHNHKPKGKWAKLEDLAGFANGIFLVFVCLSILAEALIRLIWPEQVVEVEQLLVVSILGLAVNLVGVFSFNHG